MTSVIGSRERVGEAVPHLRRFALIIAGLLAFRLVALAVNSTDLFFDEAQYWSWSRQLALGYYSKPPMIAWLIRAATEVCGAGEACVRLPAPILHALTAIIIFFAGSSLYGRLTGFWAAVLYATLPAVSLSSAIISTDVPLLTAWAAALYFYIAIQQRPTTAAALGLGVAIGIGLLSKYAMAFFAIGIVMHVVLVPSAWRGLISRHLHLALIVAALIIAPNLWWNSQNSFATFSHTADNANWSFDALHWGNALEFVAAQFGVFGPILFAGLIVVVVRLLRGGLSRQDRLLLAFSVPIIVAVTAQALISRAHANWAATAYVAASILMAATLVRDSSGRWLGASVVLHGALILILAFGNALAGKFTMPMGLDPHSRVVGWNRIAAAARSEIDRAAAAGQPYRAVLTDDRSMAAELIYYLRDRPLPMTAWQEHKVPTDHYEMTIRITAATPDPILYVTGRDGQQLVGGRFTVITPLPALEGLTIPGTARQVRLYALSGYRGEAP